MFRPQPCLLHFLNTLDPIPDELINQLNKNPQATIAKCMARFNLDQSNESIIVHYDIETYTRYGSDGMKVHFSIIELY
jgi:hypothetical protein